MSVIMTLRAHGDPKLLEQRAQGNPEGMQALIAIAKEHGVIAHRFYGLGRRADHGRRRVADPESFQRFYAATAAEIEPMMREVGVTAEPEVTFWRKLDTGDEVGWS